MAKKDIEPEKITKPLQLQAAWLVAMVALAGAFLTASCKTTQFELSVLFAVSAVLLPLVLLAIMYRLQTRYRPHLQEDKYYAEWQKRQEAEFRDFKPEVVTQTTDEPEVLVNKKSDTWQELEDYRVNQYQTSRGIFLVHCYRRSIVPGQLADIVIRLLQHGEGPLTQGKVKKVIYHLGPKFFNKDVEKCNSSDDFSFRVSAYGPMLCVAHVIFNDGSDPLILERYIDFDIPSESRMAKRQQSPKSSLVS